MDELLGTLVGRWYVTIFGAVFLWRASVHLGWRRTLVYTGFAVAVGALAENGSVHIGFPYTSYEFNPDLRGDELFIGDVPLMVPMSYAFLGYFAFASGRLLASGPRRTRGRPWAEFVLGVILSVWPIWVIDPVSRLGDEFYLGELFAYDGSGFWFGLPLGSQLGFTLTSVILVGALSWLGRTETDRPVPGLVQHPHLVALLTWHGQLFHIAIVAAVIGAHALAGAAVIMWLPAAAVVAVQWTSGQSQLDGKAQDAAHERGGQALDVPR